MGTPEMRGVGWSVSPATCVFHSFDIFDTLCTIRTPQLPSLLQAWLLHYVPPGLIFRNSVSPTKYLVRIFEESSIYTGEG